jgi:hypothetical protein
MLIDGTTSLYFSHGGGIIGAGRNMKKPHRNRPFP